jgi:UDP-glucose 4-epimerase
MNLSGSRVLVTGGAGFIGSHLTEALLETGAYVTVYDRFDGFYKGKESNLVTASESPGFTLIEGDILDLDGLDSAMKDADVVFHEAGQAGVGFSIANPRAANDVNVEGTLNVLWLAKKNGVKRLVNASSSSIFGKPDYLPMDESHPARPTSPYAVSKLAAEHYVRVFHKIYGMSTVSLRYFSVYGPRGRPDQVVHRFTESLAQGRPPLINGDGSHTRDFTHVSDVVAATTMAAEREDIGGEAFNIGFGERTSISELAEKLIVLMGKGKVKPAYAEEQKGEFPDTQADNAKARKVLGWRPKVSLDEGLKSYVEWYNSSRKAAEGAG